MLLGRTGLTGHNRKLQSEVIPARVLLGLLCSLVQDLQLPDLPVDHCDLLEGLLQPLLRVVKLFLGE